MEVAPVKNIQDRFKDCIKSPWAWKVKIEFQLSKIVTVMLVIMLQWWKQQEMKIIDVDSTNTKD